MSGGLTAWQSVFGINTMAVSPIYFPAAALPFLLLTLTIAYIADRIMKADHEPPSLPHSCSTDIEKFPVSRSVTTFEHPVLKGGEGSWTAAPGNLFRTILPNNASSRQSRPKTSRGKAVDTTENATRPPTSRMSQTAPRISFQAAQPSSLAETIPREFPFGFPTPAERLTSPDDGSMSRDRPPFSFNTTNTQPEIPDIEISNPLWPPTTFPNFDSLESPSSTSREMFAPLASIPSRASSLRQLSPNVAIRQASPVHHSRAPSPSLEEEDIADIPTTSTIVDVLENTFRPISKIVSRQHIGHQLVRTTGVDVGEQRMIETELDHNGDEEISERKVNKQESTKTERSTAEISKLKQIDYEDIERRQAEVGDSNHETEFPELSRPLISHLAPSGSASSTMLLGQGFGDQKLVLEALHTSGYVERLVNRFEGVGEAVAARPLVDPVPYSSDEYEKETKERQAPGLGFAFEQRGRLASSSVEVELYNAEDEEEEDYHHRFGTSPHAIVHSNLGSVRSGPRIQNSRKFLSSSPSTPPPPPRSSARSATSLLLPPEIASSSPLPQTQRDKPTKRTPSQASITPSTSSNETAVTARTSTRPLTRANIANNSAAFFEQGDTLYDAEGFFRSPASPPSPSPAERVMVGDEHVEHPGGLQEQGMLDLLEEEEEEEDVTPLPHIHAHQKEEEEEEYFEPEPTRTSEDTQVSAEGLSAITERTEDERSSSEVEDYVLPGSGPRSGNLGQASTVIDDYTDDFTERDDTTRREGEEGRTRTSSELCGGGSEDDDEMGENVTVEMERATRLLAGLEEEEERRGLEVEVEVEDGGGRDEGQRQRLSGSGSYTKGSLDTIPSENWEEEGRVI